MKVIFVPLFGDLDTFCEFGTIDGPHIMMDLDVLPDVGDRFDLTPDQVDSLVEQISALDYINDITVDGKPFTEDLDETVMYCYYVSERVFTYLADTKERYVLIYLRDSKDYQDIDDL